MQWGLAKWRIHIIIRAYGDFGEIIQLKIFNFGKITASAKRLKVLLDYLKSKARNCL